MGKPSYLRKIVAAGRHTCVVNEPAWGDSDTAESDDSMEVSQGSETSKQKRDYFDERRSGLADLTLVDGRGIGERDKDGFEFKIILRFGEERGLSSMSPMKLTTVLRNQIGDIQSGG